MNRPIKKLPTIENKKVEYTPEKDGDEKIGIGVERKVPKDNTPFTTSEITTLDYLKLWLVSWGRNEAKAELQGKHSPLPFDLVGGFPIKTAIAVIGAVMALIAISC